MQANTIIKAALRKLLVIPSGGTPTANQYTDGLEVLNDLVNSWSANSSLVYQDTLEEIVIAANTQNFTLGATGDYVTGKPVEIVQMSLREDSYEWPLLEAHSNEYAEFSNKTNTGQPAWYYFRNTHPDSTFYFDVTTSSAYTLILTSMKELSEFADGTTEVSLPAYYEKAFKDNLTIELAPEMGAANRVTQIMLQVAEESKNAVIGKAVKVVPSRTDLSHLNDYNNTVRYNWDAN